MSARKVNSAAEAQSKKHSACPDSVLGQGAVLKNIFIISIVGIKYCLAIANAVLFLIQVGEN